MVTEAQASESPYFDAALRWFAGIDSVQQARALVDGNATEQAAWKSFEDFGFAELLAMEESPAERASIVAGVARAAGRALYTGPLCAPPVGFVPGALQADGSAGGWQDAARSVRTSGALDSQENDQDLSLLATCARLQGVGERVLELTLEQLLTRRQFGKPLASFQALQHATVDRHCELTISGALLNEVAAHWESAALRQPALHALKAAAAPAATAACDHAVQMFGAMGFAHECDIGLYLRHAIVLAARHGTAATHRSRFAAHRVDFLPG